MVFTPLTRPTIGVIAKVGTVLVVLAVAPLAAKTDPGAPSPRFEHSICPLDFPQSLNVDCGMLTVPENRVKDNGVTVRLPVAIVRTDSSSPAPDPIVYVTGGPAYNEIDSLGYSEWNVYALSAGGVIALTAMHLYPEGIRSVILDSALGTQYEVRGPDIWRPQNLILEMVFAGCATNNACNAAYPNLRTRFYERVHALRVNPVVVNVPVEGGGTFRLTVDGDQLLVDLAACSDPVCPGFMDTAAKGDIASLYDALPISPPQPNDPFLSEGKAGVFHCHDYIAFEPDSELQHAAREIPEFRVALLTLRFIYVPTLTKDACKIWRAGRAKPDQHRLVTSPIPTLVLTGKWDGNVSSLHDQEIASTLSRSFFFQFPGIGHGTLFWGDCPNQIAGEFVDNPTTTPDSSCITTMPDLDFTPSSAVSAVSPVSG